MGFADYARSIPRAYPERPSKKPKPKKKFYSYHPNGLTQSGIDRWEIINDTPNLPGYVQCESHHPRYSLNPYTLIRAYLMELPE